MMISAYDAVTYIGRVPIHKPISFSLNSGEIGILTGANGSGKTTFFRGLLGELHIKRGSVDLFGRSIEYGQPHVQSRSIVRIIPQFPIQPNGLMLSELLKVWQYFLHDRDIVDITKVTDSIEQLIEKNSNTCLGLLSHGQKRLIDIELAVAANPKLLLADEPMAGLSASMSKWAESRLREFVQQGGTLLVIAHEHECPFTDSKWRIEVTST